MNKQLIIYNDYKTLKRYSYCTYNDSILHINLFYYTVSFDDKR